MLALVYVQTEKIKKLSVQITQHRNVLLVNALFPKRRTGKNIKQLTRYLQSKKVHAVISNTGFLEREFTVPQYTEYVRLRQADVALRYLKAGESTPVFIDSAYNRLYLEQIVKRCAQLTGNIYVSPSLSARELLEKTVRECGISFLITNAPPPKAVRIPLPSPERFEVEIPMPYSRYKPPDIPSGRFAGMLWECTRDENIANWPILGH